MTAWIVLFMIGEGIIVWKNKERKGVGEEMRWVIG
jgi:hypothetical protein